MDSATQIGLALSGVGTIATIWAAIVATKQAKDAAKSATEAIRARNQIVNQGRTSDLAELKVHCERAIRSMEKYGPAASPTSLIGTSPTTDANDVQKLILEANRLKELFPRNEAELFVHRISPLLIRFVSPAEQGRVPENGRAVLMETSTFLGVVKTNLDIKRESISSDD